jgi:hypothetical protein
LNELQHNVQVFGVLTDSVGPDVKIKVKRVQNKNLVFQVIDLFALDNLVFFELFENEVLLGSDIFNELDTSKGTLSQNS